MAEQGLIGGGWSRMARNKRYIVWFYLLNVLLAWFGAGAFQNQAHALLDHSLLSEKLVHGFDVGVYAEMLARPEFGPTSASMAPALHFILMFFFVTALFLPGVLLGYSSTYRLPREDFFRACGRNLWRFIRLMIVAGIVMGIIAGILFGIQGALVKKAGDGPNELLGPALQFGGLLIIFLVMTMLRIWFDLAETDVVMSDQRAVRRSIGKGWRHLWKSLASLLGSYVLTTIVAAIFLVGGIWVWLKFVPAASVFGAVIVSQLTLLLLLIPRFWQRGVAVSYYLREMVEPIAVQSFVPVVVPVAAAPVAEEPAAPALPEIPPETQSA